MRKIGMVLMVMMLMVTMPAVQAQTPQPKDTTEVVGDTLAADSAMAMIDAELNASDDESQADGSLHKQLKKKFIEGSAGFMSLVALALVLGLAFCIERIVYLTLSEVNTKKLLKDVDARLEQGGHRSPAHQLRHRTNLQHGEGLLVDTPVHRCRSLTGIPRHGDWYGDVFRPD